MSHERTAYDRPTLSRRGMLAGGAALTALTALSPARTGHAQTPTADQSSKSGPSNVRPVVLITGTSSGFGRLMAETFALNDLRVIATMRDLDGRNAPAAEELRDLAAGDGLAIDLVEIDVTDQASVERGVAEALALAGQIDILVNNAGVVLPGPTALQPVDAFNANIDTNLNGALRMFREVAPQMRERGEGYLIQFSSAIGRILDPMLGGYSASKLAVEAAADALAYEEAMFGIEVTVVQPAGSYPTRLQENGLRAFEEMLAGLPASEQPTVDLYSEHIAHMRDGLVPASTLDPQEVADAVLGLISLERGSRPRRLSVGPFKATIDGLNAAHDEVQDYLIEQSGLTELTTLR